MSGWVAPTVVRAIAPCVVFAFLGVSAAAAQSYKEGPESRPFPYVDEIRFGAFVHQVGGSPGEHGVDVNVELLTPQLGEPSGDNLRDHFLRPRLHVGGDINANGDTSQGYFGLAWNLPLTNRFFLEASFGGSVNNGYVARKPGHTALGSHLNFRESASLGFHVSERWDVLATVDHMSNAGLCTYNRGLTEAGLRVGYKF